MAGSSNKISSICVFGGSQLGKDNEYLQMANQLGRILAEKRINLVYGGGIQGLLGCDAIWASVGGGKVVELTPTPLKGSLHDKFSNKPEVSTMHEKIQQMMEHSDTFIALPSGLETLAEIFQVASWAELNILSKPFGVLNIDGFYGWLLTFPDHAVIIGFMTKWERQSFVTDSNPEQLIEQLEVFEYKYDPTVAQIDWSGNRGKKRKAGLDLTSSL